MATKAQIRHGVIQMLYIGTSIFHFPVAYKQVIEDFKPTKYTSIFVKTSYVFLAGGMSLGWPVWRSIQLYEWANDDTNKKD